ncbi:PhzF family phenazine biosynthesis protein [Segetibacter sp. 3557_3]|uniref:PhzF family phenazine biosynthesis protein n=1 Tax=Segetibacter sp. 3557_3 TaxID=2547429 RepID=UPI001058501D|nr:PhzF family phenazine biosynthesis protein [Segetibacter sp. 3557_3]TDH25614.1 PhzF family phenazine biosynthesis protein [Segetibacter sp. 3557_3]
MQSYPLFHVDAFTDQLFGGNPAVVCPLETWLPEDTMQRLAAENNLSETAFFIKEEGGYHVRWFTPEYEIDLCGHATLATAFVLFEHLGYEGDTIRFSCKSGLLEVTRKDGLIQLDFPTRIPAQAEAPEALLKGINIQPAQILKSRDYFLVYNQQSEVADFRPDFTYLNQLDCVGIIVTAPGRDVDFVSRFFVPNSVIGEDPVTGSAHCNLIPYWSGQLNKTTLTARQISARGGQLTCTQAGDRVLMAGKAVLYMKGEYYL